MKGIDLSGLRDIHLPVQPSWWPPAIGWWVVVAMVILGTVGCVLLFLFWRSRPKQYALRELKQAYRRTDNPVVLARRMSELFKRIALIRYPRKRVAGLSEEDWMHFLLTKTRGAFSEEQAKLLAFSTYLPDNTLTTDDTASLYEAGYRGIKELFKRKKHGN